MPYPKREVRHIQAKYICLFFLLLLAVWQDFKSYKIPNLIILFGYSLSLLFFLQEYEWTSITKWVGWILIPILILFPLFIIKAIGAGDIKLFSVICGFLGITFVLNLVVVSFVFAAILSICKLIKTKDLNLLLLSFLTYFRNFPLRLLKPNKSKNLELKYYDLKKEGKQGVIHFSLAIFLAFIIIFLDSLMI